jgi:hypothetical protein
MGGVAAARGRITELCFLTLILWTDQVFIAVWHIPSVDRARTALVSDSRRTCSFAGSTTSVTTARIAIKSYRRVTASADWKPFEELSSQTGSSQGVLTFLSLDIANSRFWDIDACLISAFQRRKSSILSAWTVCWWECQLSPWGNTGLN